jgi:hypothetical protein
MDSSQLKAEGLLVGSSSYFCFFLSFALGAGIYMKARRRLLFSQGKALDIALTLPGS